jgi:hypothetical protein
VHRARIQGGCRLELGAFAGAKQRYFSDSKNLMRVFINPDIGIDDAQISIGSIER